MTKVDTKNRVLVMLIVIAMTILSAFPAPAEAKNQYYYIQTAVNTNTWLLDGSVVDSTGGVFATPLEVKRFSSVERTRMANAQSVGSMTSDIRGLDMNSKKTLSGLIDSVENNMPLTFPGSKDLLDKPVNYYTNAQTVLTSLINGLNQSIELAYPESERSNWDVNTAKQNIAGVLSAAGRGGTAGQATFSRPTADEVSDAFRGMDLSTNDCVKVTVSTLTGSTSYIIQMRAKKEAGDSPEYIIWDHLVYQAFNNLRLEDPVTTENVSVGVTSQSENWLASILGGLLRSIEGVLNLWSIDELVFNQGSRAGYVHGAIPGTWETYLWTFFVFFMIIAACILFGSLVHAIFTRVTSTANFRGRFMAWEKVQSIVLVAIILAVLPILIQILLTMSEGLTAAFRAIPENPMTIKEMRNAYVGGTGAIGGIVIEVLYFGVDIYYNFYYMLRSLALFVYIALSPIGVVALSFSPKFRQIAMNWFSSLLSYVLIQPIHAFLFMIIMMLPKTGHAFDAIICFYATIPFASAIRNMLIPGGDILAQAAGAAKDRTVGAVKGASFAGGATLAAGVGAYAGGVLSTKQSSQPADSTDQGLLKNKWGEMVSRAKIRDSAGGIRQESAISSEPSSSGLAYMNDTTFNGKSKEYTAEDREYDNNIKDLSAQDVNSLGLDNHEEIATGSQHKIVEEAVPITEVPEQTEARTSGVGAVQGGVDIADRETVPEHSQAVLESGSIQAEGVQPVGLGNNDAEIPSKETPLETSEPAQPEEPQPVTDQKPLMRGDQRTILPRWKTARAVGRIGGATLISAVGGATGSPVLTRMGSQMALGARDTAKIGREPLEERKIEPRERVEVGSPDDNAIPSIEDPAVAPKTQAYYEPPRDDAFNLDEGETIKYRKIEKDGHKGDYHEVVIGPNAGDLSTKASSYSAIWERGQEERSRGGDPYTDSDEYKGAKAFKKMKRDGVLASYSKEDENGDMTSVVRLNDYGLSKFERTQDDTHSGDKLHQARLEQEAMQSMEEQASATSGQQ